MAHVEYDFTEEGLEPMSLEEEIIGQMKSLLEHGLNDYGLASLDLAITFYLREKGFKG